MYREKITEDDMDILSIPIHRGMVRMQALRDFVEASSEAPENAVVYVLPAELRLESEA